VFLEDFAKRATGILKEMGIVDNWKIAADGGRMTFLNKDTWIGLFMLAVASLYWLEADKIRITRLDGPVGAPGVPKALAYALGALAIVLILRSVVSVFLSRRTALADAATTKSKTGSEKMREHVRALGMLAIGVAYLLVIQTLGYTISVMFLILTVSLYIGAPFNVRTLLVSLGGGVLFYLLFVKFLGIPLPDGAIISALTGAVR
jgi:hypothetical protein